MLKFTIKKIIFLIIFFLISSTFFVSWKFLFKNHKKNLNSMQYEEIIKKIHENKLNNKKEIERFIVDNNNVYGILTSMFLAKQNVLNNNLDEAIIALKNGLKYTKEENLKNILKLRIAKIKIQKNENKDAVDILNNIQNNNWKNIIDNMKGDIFIKEKKNKDAINLWKKSQKNEDSNASKEIIEMKINELKEETKNTCKFEK